MSTAPLPPKAPSASPGLPEPLKTLHVAAGPDATTAGPEYPICWSSDGSADRTKGAILEAIQPLFDASKATAAPAPARILELASGLGDHLKHFAELNPDIVFTPSECDPHLVLRATQACHGHGNITPGLLLNALERKDWDGLRTHLAGKAFDGVVIQNLLHIAPAGVTSALFEHLSPRAPAPLLSPSHGWISIYGAFIDDGVFGSEGDREFGAHIKGLSPHLGLRDISRFLVPEAEKWGLELQQRIAMPKGNWVLVFRPKA